MLQGIRDRAQGVLMWIIVGLIIATFALWGIHQYFGPDANVVVAKVNDRELTLPEFQDAYQRQRFRLQAMLGPQFDLGRLDDRRLKRETLQQMIDQEVMLQSAAAHGLRVGDEQLALQIRAISAFQADDGFSQAQYESWLRNQGYSPGYFEHNFRRSLLTDQLQSAVASSALVTEAAVDQALRLQEQTRDFAYLLVPMSAFRNQVDISEDETKDYYESRRASFVNPEQVSVEYLVLSKGTIAEQISIEQSELERRYGEQKANYVAAEQRRASHILIAAAQDAPAGEIAAAEKKAQELSQRLAAGESFEELAKAESDDPGSADLGGDLGYFSRGVMDKPFEEAVFAMQSGEISDPVRSSFGFHIIRLEGVQAGEVKPLAEVQEQVRRELQLEKAEHLYFEQAEQLANLAFENPDTLEIAAEAIGLEVQESEFFGRGGGPGILADRKVVAAAFADEVLVNGNNSEPLELANGRIVVLRAKEHRPPSDRALEEVRSEIVSLLTDDKAREMATAQGQLALKALREGADGEAIAKERDLKWSAREEVARTDSSTPAAVVKRAFQLNRPSPGESVYGSTVLPSGDFALISLTAVQDGDPDASNKATRDALRASLERGLGEEVFSGFLQALRAGSSIETFADNLE
ncbi:MAG: SurA N-terminal domain-containing protein [Gammaproteobacteria bacterium]|nr:SurA N-terminal domain-containing protein [Gammaproteobacteria bacterium]